MQKKLKKKKKFQKKFKKISKKLAFLPKIGYNNIRYKNTATIVQAHVAVFLYLSPVNTNL